MVDVGRDHCLDTLSELCANSVAHESVEASNLQQHRKRHIGQSAAETRGNQQKAVAESCVVGYDFLLRWCVYRECVWM